MVVQLFYESDHPSLFNSILEDIKLLDVGNKPQSLSQMDAPFRLYPIFANRKYLETGTMRHLIKEMLGSESPKTTVREIQILKSCSSIHDLREGTSSCQRNHIVTDINISEGSTEQWLADIIQTVREIISVSTKKAIANVQFLQSYD